MRPQYIYAVRIDYQYNHPTIKIKYTSVVVYWCIYSHNKTCYLSQYVLHIEVLVIYTKWPVRGLILIFFTKNVWILFKAYETYIKESRQDETFMV